MKVIKFGGTSVGEVHAIEQLCYILRDKKKQNYRYTIIISAIGGITDKLINCAQYTEQKNNKYYLILDEIEIKHLNIIIELFTFFHKRSIIKRIIKCLNILELFYKSILYIKYLSKISLNKIMNFGELISSYLINEKLKENGFNSIWKDSRYLIVSDDQYQSVQVNFSKSYLRIKYSFIKENVPYIILPGFISSSIFSSTLTETSTLGRGGSDYSASILSSAIQTESLEIWTDVSGILPAHPKIVSKAFSMENISYKKAIEFSHFGAKIIYPPTLLPSMKNNIPIMIRNTFSPLEIGTFIFIPLDGTKGIVTGITGIQNITRELKQILKKYPIDKKLCMIAIIVNEMKNIPVTLSRMFSTLRKENININGIGYIGKNISTVIKKKYFKKSMKTLHDLFLKKTYKSIHLFIAGLGKVGSKLIEQLNKQKEYIIEELNLQLKVIGICNSKIMYFNIKGVNLNNWKDNLLLGINMTIEKLIISLYNVNLYNKIFVDNTASKEIASIYDDLLGKKIGIVTCNKIACASSYQEYKNIKSIASYFSVPFFFETNVGAGLPIINTLSNFGQSGNKIHLIYAVLSGSLNFILNKGSLIEIIREAKKKGFTEPDIRLDFSGIDVIRKILILIRECGKSIELESIKQTPLLPKMCLKTTTINNFYKKLFSTVDRFIELSTVAKEQKKILRIIEKYKYGETSVGLENIEFEHPFYHLDKKDNMILYTTKRYADQPILVQGPGAGAEVTASGIFSDIIKASIYIDENKRN